MSIDLADRTEGMREPPEFVSRPQELESNEFNYRPVPVVAVVGFVLALISAAGIFIWLALPLAVLAGLVSLAAVWTIRRSQGAYGGRLVAWSGLALSIAFFVGGLSYQVYAYQTEVPKGYTRVSFVDDISAQPFVERNGRLEVDEDVKALQGKKIFLKGFIYPSGTMEGIESFLLLKDNQQCCFGGKPALTDRIGVIMQDGRTIDYYSGRVSVAGVFELNPNYTGENDLEPVYVLKGEYCTPARSDF